MDPRRRHPHGLRPTIRHLMILVAHVATVSSIAASLLRGDPGSGAYVAASVLLPLSPPLLALLLLTLDRPGPTREWLVGLLTRLTTPSFLAWTACHVGLGSVQEQSLPAVVLAALLHGLCVYYGFPVAESLPGRCPECGVRASVPVGRGRLCASCGLTRSRPGGPRYRYPSSSRDRRGR